MLPANANPQKHIIICCNTREQGDCCGKTGEELYLKLKEFVKTNCLVGKVWVTRARCLGFCNPAGASVVIYPDKKWFSHATMEDFEKIKEMIIS